MASQYRCTAFFKQSIKGIDYGWTETHYNLQQADLITALNQFTVLMGKRVKLLGYGVELAYQRVSDDLLFRDSDVVDGPVPKQATPICYNPDFNDVPADFSYSDLLLRLDNPQHPFYRRSMYLPGNPDVLQDITLQSPFGSLNPIEAKWARAFQAWETEMISGRWGMKCIIVDPAVNPENLIIGIAVGPPVVFTVQGVHGLVDGDQIRIRGAKNKNFSTNGIHTVQVVDGSHFKCTDITTDPGFISGGLVRKRYSGLIPYKQISARRFGSRKKGRFFDQPRGRARAR